MRFLLKLAFLIGLVLFILAPARDGQEGVPDGLSIGALVYAAQQTATDLGGFCDRAPMACESGRDAIQFAGARIAEGLTFVYGLAAGSAERAPVPAPPAVQPAAEPAEAAPLHPARAPAAPPPRPYVAPAG